MKRSIIYILIGCLLFGLIGCSKPQPTPAVQSVASQRSSAVSQEESLPEESVAENAVEEAEQQSKSEPTATSSKLTSKPAESSKDKKPVASKPSASSDASDKPVSDSIETIKIDFEPWAPTEESAHYIQHTQSTANEVAFAAVISSHEEWSAFLDSGKMFYNTIESEKQAIRSAYLSRYPQTYFDEGKSLLLIAKKGGSSSEDAVVKSMVLKQQELTVELDVEYPFFTTADSLKKLYLVEVADSLSLVTELHLTVNILKGDNNGNSIKRDTVEYDFPAK